MFDSGQASTRADGRRPNRPALHTNQYRTARLDKIVPPRRILPPPPEPSIDWGGIYNALSEADPDDLALPRVALDFDPSWAARPPNPPTEAVTRIGVTSPMSRKAQAIRNASDAEPSEYLAEPIDMLAR
jgi:hypothetical protein